VPCTKMDIILIKFVNHKFYYRLVLTSMMDFYGLKIKVKYFKYLFRWNNVNKQRYDVFFKITYVDFTNEPSICIDRFPNIKLLTSISSFKYFFMFWNICDNGVYV
jgi:hypothetical protein